MNYKITILCLALLGTSGYFLYDYVQEVGIPEGSANTPISYILFDFDGTLIDAFDEAINVANELANSYGFKKISPEEKESIRHLSMREIIFDHMKIPWYRLPFLVYRAKKLLAKKIDTMHPFDGIIPGIRQLKQQGYRLAIITTNTEETVSRFLKNNNLDVFDVIYGNASLFGKHKSINQFLSKFKIPRQAVVYVGDEVRDIEAAHTVGIKIIAVSWGFNSYEALMAHKPTALIQQPSELITAINQLPNARPS